MKQRTRSVGPAPILPSAYGVAGFYSVMAERCASERMSEDYEAALLSAAAAALSRERVKAADRRANEIARGYDEKELLLAQRTEALERERRQLISGYFGDRPGLSQELADIESLRRMNTDISGSLKWAMGEIERLKRAEAKP